MARLATGALRRLGGGPRPALGLAAARAAAPLTTPLRGLSSIQAQPSPASSIEQRFAPILRVLGYYGKDSTRARQAEKLFRACAVQATHPIWAKRGAVKTKQFRPQHAVLFAHVWVLHRALEETEALGRKEARLLQEAVFDELWEDTTARIRVTGVNEISVNKHLGDVQKYSFAAALEYDNAVAIEDEAESSDALAAAVWRHVYLASDDLSVEHCVDVATYVKRQLDIVRKLGADELRDGDVDWTLPQWR
jgi:cytochrome b pre-mRNA-processing protein 3